MESTHINMESTHIDTIRKYINMAIQCPEPTVGLQKLVIPTPLNEDGKKFYTYISKIIYEKIDEGCTTSSLDGFFSTLLFLLKMDSITEFLEITKIPMMKKTGVELEYTTFFGRVLIGSQFSTKTILQISDLTNKEKQMNAIHIHNSCDRHIMSIFSIYLNSEDSKIRSYALSFIANLIEKSKFRIVPNYYQSTKCIQPYTFSPPIITVDSSILSHFEDLPSPHTLITMCRMLTYMIKSIMNYYTDTSLSDLFNLRLALLLPNMIHIDLESLCKALPDEYKKEQIIVRGEIKGVPTDTRNAATRGLLLLYFIKYIEVGLLPEMAQIRKLKTMYYKNTNIYRVQNILHNLYVRQCHIYDTVFLGNVFEIWLLFIDMMKNKNNNTRFYPQSFISTMVSFMVELNSIDPNYFKTQYVKVSKAFETLVELLGADDIMDHKIRYHLIIIMNMWYNIYFMSGLSHKQIKVIKILYTNLMNIYRMDLSLDCYTMRRNIEIRILSLKILTSYPKIYQPKTIITRSTINIPIHKWTIECLSNSKQYFKIINATLANASTKIWRHIYLIDIQNFLNILLKVSNYWLTNYECDLLSSVTNLLLHLISNIPNHEHTETNNINNNINNSIFNLLLLYNTLELKTEVVINKNFNLEKLQEYGKFINKMTLYTWIGQLTTLYNNMK